MKSPTPKAGASRNASGPKSSNNSTSAASDGGGLQYFLTADPMNPNRMSDEQKAIMADALAEFGDLGGIVLNRRTGFLIGGHQRADVLKDSKINVTDLEEPESDGTVARGWIEHGGRRYGLRVVDWPSEKAHAAMLAANRFGRIGHDEPDALAALLKSLDGEIDLSLTGFDADAIEHATGMFNIGEALVPKLSDEDRAPFRQMTFILHDEQFAVVEEAIRKAKSDGATSKVNENSNGNALSHICATFING